MAGMFDLYNQQGQKGPENDYQQALSLIAPKNSQAPNWANYTGDAGNSGEMGKAAGKALFGKDRAATAFADSQMISPEQADKMNASSSAQGQMAPQGAMGMVSPQASPKTQWANYGGGGGGGMDMSSVMSIASAFI